MPPPEVCVVRRVQTSFSVTRAMCVWRLLMTLGTARFETPNRSTVKVACARPSVFIMPAVETGKGTVRVSGG